MVKKKKSVKQEKGDGKAGNPQETEHAEQPEVQGKKQKTAQTDDRHKSEAAADNGNGGDKGKAGSNGVTDTAGIQAEEKIREAQEKYLRLAAEFDNYRKRTLKEKADLVRLAGENIISELLPVIDDFDRALQSLDDNTEAGALKKGVEIIHTKLKDFLKQKGVKEIEALGNDFDTDLHEAVTKIPVEDKKKKGKIVDVVEKGYLLHDKVIRYAKVVVGE